MTLYDLTVAEHELDRLSLTLVMLGTKTKPFYLCQLRHSREGIDLMQPVSFFLESLVDPTEAINATVSIGRGLTAIAARHGFTAAYVRGRELAAKVQWKDGVTKHHSKEWEGAKALFVRFETNQSFN